MNGYYLWSGLGAIEEIEDAEPLTDTPGKALRLLQAKQSGHWTLWLREGYRAILVATWVRGKLTLIPIDMMELEDDEAARRLNQSPWG